MGSGEDPAPSAGFDVGGVDDALGLVRVGDDLEQETTAFLVDGYVPKFIDDDQARFTNGRQLFVESLDCQRLVGWFGEGFSLVVGLDGAQVAEG